MNNYICKIGDKQNLLDRWNYLIDTHPGNEIWEIFKSDYIKKFDNDAIIPYYGILNGKIICEITAYTKPEAFVRDIQSPEGLYGDEMAYLAAFRTDKEYEGKGYFSTLYKFVEKDLKQRGYKELSLGVSPNEVRNIEIYFHLGYKKYIKTVLQNKNEYVNFYKKELYK